MPNIYQATFNNVQLRSIFYHSHFLIAFYLNFSGRSSAASMQQIAGNVWANKLISKKFVDLKNILQIHINRAFLAIPQSWKWIDENSLKTFWIKFNSHEIDAILHSSSFPPKQLLKILYIRVFHSREKDKLSLAYMRERNNTRKSK